MSFCSNPKTLFDIDLNLKERILLESFKTMNWYQPILATLYLFHIAVLEGGSILVRGQKCFFYSPLGSQRWEMRIFVTMVSFATL